MSLVIFILHQIYACGAHEVPILVLPDHLLGFITAVRTILDLIIELLRRVLVADGTLGVLHHCIHHHHNLYFYLINYILEISLVIYTIFFVTIGI